MLLNCENLRQYMMAILLARFGREHFPRCVVLKLTEFELKRDRLWESRDDEPSGSSNGTPRGMARIDWQVSELARTGKIEKVCPGVWKIRG
jgi:hypothetical protein